MSASPAHVAGKGLVVLTGCGHAGIVNVIRQAQALTGVDQVYAVLGGFHLSGAGFEQIIPPTIEALRQIIPAVLAPAHCSGWRAVHALARALPDSFIQNSVGTRYDLLGGCGVDRVARHWNSISLIQRRNAPGRRLKDG